MGQDVIKDVIKDVIRKNHRFAQVGLRRICRDILRRSRIAGIILNVVKRYVRMVLEEVRIKTGTHCRVWMELQVGVMGVMGKSQPCP